MYTNIVWGPLLVLALIAAVLQLVFGRLFHLYRGRFRIGSFHEVAAMAKTVVAVALVIGIPVVVGGTLVKIPRATVTRRAADRSRAHGHGAVHPPPAVRAARRNRAATSSRPIYGNGHLASFLVPQMLTDPTSMLPPLPPPPRRPAPPDPLDPWLPTARPG